MCPGVEAETGRTFAVETARRVDAVPVLTYVGYDCALVYVYSTHTHIVPVLTYVGYDRAQSATLGITGGDAFRAVRSASSVSRYLSILCLWTAFSALTLLVGRQEEHPAFKN